MSHETLAAQSEESSQRVVSRCVAPLRLTMGSMFAMTSERRVPRRANATKVNTRPEMSTEATEVAGQARAGCASKGMQGDLFVLNSK
jgi:hypothetical protein